MWKVKIKPDWHEKPLTVFCEEFVMEGYFFTIDKVRKQHRSSTIVLPDDEAYNELVDMEKIIFPYSVLIYAGEVENKGEQVKFQKKLVQNI